MKGRHKPGKAPALLTTLSDGGVETAAAVNAASSGASETHVNYGRRDPRQAWWWWTLAS